MNQLFHVTISATGTGETMVQIEVEVQSPDLRVAAIRLYPPAVSDSRFPPELADLDFRQCISIARQLTDGNVNADPPALSDEHSSPTADRDVDGQSPGLTRPSKPRVSSRISQPRRVDDKSGSVSVSKTGAPSDLGVVYWRLGSVPKVASHYNVPHQIARDWIKELREGTGRRS